MRCLQSIPSSQHGSCAIHVQVQHEDPCKGPNTFNLRHEQTSSAWVQVSGEKEFFSEMVVDAVKHLDPQTLDLAMLGIKKVRFLALWRDLMS